MITVEEAEKIIQSRIRDFGTETILFELALGRVLAEDLRADRDLPPFNRLTVDGIAIRFEEFEKGARSFKIKAVQAAGDAPVNITAPGECIEIMTGAALPASTDTVIRYEELDIKNGVATVRTESVIKGQYLHTRGKDKKQHEVLATAHQPVTPALISMAASIGKTALPVKKLPRTVIISSGAELIAVDEMPSPYQIRRSNTYATRAILRPYGLEADIMHVPDEPGIIRERIADCLALYDVILLSGGVSMGRFDYIPVILQDLSVRRLFHKVQQRPGKPFWFGSHANGVLVFAFPGNPVSAFLCVHRYFIPWLEASLGLTPDEPRFAQLDGDYTFTASLKCFLQVRLCVTERGQWLATPCEGNGSGDFTNLLTADAFMELPLEQHNFRKGEVYRVWPFSGRRYP